MQTRFNRGRTIAGVVGVVLCGLVVRGAVVSHPQHPTVTLSPELNIQLDVANLDRSIEFYTTKLGFRMTERRDDLQFAHLETNVPGVEIGLGVVATPKPSGVTLNFSVKDVDASRKALEAAGVMFRGATVEIPGKVKLAGFTDPDGHSLRLAGPVKPPK